MQVYNPYDLVVVKSKEDVDPQFFYVLTQTGAVDADAHALALHVLASAQQQIEKEQIATELICSLVHATLTPTLRVTQLVAVRHHALQVSRTCGTALHMT